jgi:hypothetical protein
MESVELGGWKRRYKQNNVAGTGEEVRNNKEACGHGGAPGRGGINPKT